LTDDSLSNNSAENDQSQLMYIKAIASHISIIFGTHVAKDTVYSFTPCHTLCCSPSRMCDIDIRGAILLEIESAPLSEDEDDECVWTSS